MLLTGDVGEVAKEGAGGLHAGLGAGGGGAQRVDDGQGRLEGAAHLEQELPLEGMVEFDETAGPGGEHEEELAALDPAAVCDRRLLSTDDRERQRLAYSNGRVLLPLGQ